MVWGLVLAIVIALHLFGYFIYKMGGEVLEYGNHFPVAIGAFLVLFIAAVIGLKFLIPNPGAADIATIPQAWMQPVFAAE
jgi:predicted cobalt transporter CbtA